ncbi:RNA polymerase sigma factor [Lactococcus laudensis]|uniref:RNA polymerase sigma factor n=1 Tax=Pseudolactococcus laudensis TaxID=1494461 RepID=UPI002FCC5811
MKTGANPADAQDIVQDVFIKLIQADIVLAPDKLRPWLYRVALSRFYDLYRREKRYQALLSERFYLIYGNVVNLDNDRSWQLEQALQTLTDYQLGLVTLYYEDDKSVKDISEIYQISEAKVKTDLYRLRHKLKQEMEQNNEDE